MKKNKLLQTYGGGLAVKEARPNYEAGRMASSCDAERGDDAGTLCSPHAYRFSDETVNYAIRLHKSHASVIVPLRRSPLPKPLQIIAEREENFRPPWPCLVGGLQGIHASSKVTKVEYGMRET